MKLEIIQPDQGIKIIENVTGVATNVRKDGLPQIIVHVYDDENPKRYRPPTHIFSQGEDYIEFRCLDHSYFVYLQ